MIRPDELKKNDRLRWSTGSGNDVWDLFCACIAGDVGAVKQLVEKDPSIVRCQYQYRTPLYFAVREDRLDVARFLLDQGAYPFGLGIHDSLLQMARDRGYVAMERLLEERCSTLHGASQRGDAIAAAIRDRDIARVRVLLDASPDLLHAGDSVGNQPIHWATMTRQLDVIDELLARGADINAKRPNGARPLQLTNGDYRFRGWRDVPKEVETTAADVLAHIRARGAYVDICTAASIGDLPRVRELVEHDPSLANSVSEYVTYYLGSGTPLRNAAAQGHLEIVKLLLAHGADPNLPEEGIAPKGHALYAAVASGHLEIARLLLENGAYPSPPVESSADALSRAISQGNQPMIELLCSNGAAREVHLLAYHGDVQTAAAVFAANPALADDPEALENAAGEGQESFVRLMLRYQPDLPRRVAVGVRSQGPDASIKTRELAELLFQHGMDPSHPDWLHVTSLHRFAQRGDLENAMIFLDHGADIHARDEDICSTPLGWAAKFGRIAMVELLLNRGASPNLPDDPPWATPLAWATKRGHNEIVDLLKRLGAA